MVCCRDMARGIMRKLCNVIQSLLQRLSDGESLLPAEAALLREALSSLQLCLHYHGSHISGAEHGEATVLLAGQTAVAALQVRLTP